MQRFNIVVPKADGSVEVHPMKEWLRQNPQHIPAGLDPTLSTSHQLRNGLKKRGWQVQESSNEVRLIMGSTSDAEALVDSVLGSPEGSEECEETSFRLEAELRDFIVRNLPRISVGGRKVKLFVDTQGRPGVEYRTDVGLIDILGTDDSGGFVVFELKLERGPDKALGQLARYMGWIKATLAQEKSVTGVIVARSIDRKLQYAVLAIPHVLLLEYEVDFRVNPVGSILNRSPDS